MTRTVQQFGGVTNGATPTATSTGTTGPGWTTTTGTGGSIYGVTGVPAQIFTGGASIRIDAGGSSAATFMSTSLTALPQTARGRWVLMGLFADPVGASITIGRLRATAGSPTISFSITHKTDGFLKLSSGNADLQLNPSGSTTTLKTQTPSALSYSGGNPTWVAFDVYVDLTNNKLKGAFIDPTTGGFALGMTAYVELLSASVGATAFSSMSVGKLATEVLTTPYSMIFDSTNDEDSYISAAPSTGSVAYTATPADSIGVTDSSLNQAQIVQYDLADSIGVTDAATAIGGIRNLADIAGVTDTVSAVITSAPIPPPANLTGKYPFIFGRCTQSTYGAVVLDLVNLPDVLMNIEASSTLIGGSSRSSDGTKRQDRFALKREWPSLALGVSMDLSSWWPVLRMWQAGGPWLFYDHTNANLLTGDQRMMLSWTNPAGAALTIRGDASTNVSPNTTVQMGPTVNPPAAWLAPVAAGGMYFAGCTVRGATGWSVSVSVAWFNSARTIIQTDSAGIFTAATALSQCRMLDGNVIGSRVGGAVTAPAGAAYAQIILSPTVASVDVSDPAFVPGPADPGNAMVVVQLNEVPETHTVVTKAAMTLNMSEM